MPGSGQEVCWFYVSEACALRSHRTDARQSLFCVVGWCVIGSLLFQGMLCCLLSNARPFTMVCADGGLGVAFHSGGPLTVEGLEV